MSASTGNPASARRARVLVVDDEPLLGTTLRVTLEEDHDVVIAQSGEAAQALLEQDTAFDVILCDLMMPRTSGMDLYAWLRAANPGLAERMIFMTGGAYTAQAQDFLENVPNRHIDKPFEVRALVELIAAVAG